LAVGIEALNVYGGRAYLDVGMLAQARGLDPARFQNLLMKRKTVALNFEDPVSFAVNAAKPLIDRLAAAERDRIELLIVCTESGIDFGKAMSSYVHHYLGLRRNCRTFEVKHACYGGTAGFQMAVAYVLSGMSPGAKALVITTDIARPIPHTYTEPSQGAAAVAMLIGDRPTVMEMEVKAHGVHGYEVMDSFRPSAEIETGDADLSLLTYLDCIEQSFLDYRRKIGDVDFQDHFRHLAFHTPFGGMVKGAHRTMMRKFKRLPPAAVEEDFQRRMAASLTYCREVGNVYSGTVFLALAGTLEHGGIEGRQRIGLFSYGSGCCSEFYSGLADESASRTLAAMRIGPRLEERHELDMADYERLIQLNRLTMVGTEQMEPDLRATEHIYRSQFAGQGLLVLGRIKAYHREYRWS
jgi:polyketide biosynthesis 3-hydroxy-3-methylglutaryl-CoA synthase-like enzyme PksG